MQPSRDIRLIEIMAALRRPGTGCGWDIAQTFEEAYEIADAVARWNMRDFKEELGLLQVVFQARLPMSAGFPFRRKK